MPDGVKVDDILSLWQQAVEEGRSPSAEELCANAPELLPEVRRRIDILAALGALKPHSPKTLIDTAPSPEPPPRPRLIGPPGYDLLGVLGRGGMGVVYKARQVGLNRIVALKMILGGAHAGDEERLRFLAEAEVVACLHHAGIVQVHDFGTHDGVPYFALEYCNGGSLDDHLQGQPLAPALAARLVASLADAVQHAHAQGVIHRDLKPGNVLLQLERPGAPVREALRAAVPKITDFGLARRLEAAGCGLTRPNAIMGTPSYMSPEQAKSSADAGAPADVWALGAILYECLTGRPPFKADTAQETLAQLATHDPAPPRSLQPAVPADLETVCLKCLQKDPRKRYPSARELADDLRRFLRGEPVLARRTGTAERLWRWGQRHPAIAGLVTGIVALTAAAMVAVTAAWREAARDRDEAREQRNRAEVLLYASQIAGAQFEIGQEKQALASKHLDSCRWDLRGWEHHLLASNLRGEQVRLDGHADGIAAVALSPDGRLAASAGRDGVVRVWELRGGRPLHRLPHPAQPRSLCFLSPARLVSGDKDGAIRIWDCATGQRVAEHRTHLGPVNALAAVPGGRSFVSGYGDQEVRVHDATGKPAVALAGIEDAITCVAVSRDGRHVAAGDENGTVRLWRLPGLRPVKTFLAAEAGVTGVAFAPNGQTVVTGGGGGSVKVWTADGRPVRDLGSHRGRVAGLGFSPDGTALISASLDDTLIVWDPDTGRRRRRIEAGAGGLGAAAWSPDGRLVVSGGEDGALRVHDAWHDPARADTADLRDPLAAAAWSPDGSRLAVASWDGTVRLFGRGLRAGRPLRGHEGEVVAVAWVGPGLLLSGARDGTARVWDADAGTPLHQLEGEVNAVAAHPDGRTVASVGRDGAVHIWDARSGTRLLDLDAGDDEKNAAAFSPSGDLLAVAGADGLVHVWATRNWYKLDAWAGHTRAVTCLAFSPDGRSLVSGSTDHSVRLWDRRGRTLWVLEGHTEPVLSAAWSPDGTRVVSTSEDGQVAVWHPGTGERLLKLAAHAAQASAAVFSPDGGVLVTSGYDGKLRRWDGRTGRARLALQRPPAEVTAVERSADGTRVVGTAQGKVVEWDAGTGRLLTDRQPAGPGRAGFRGQVIRGEPSVICLETERRNRDLARARLARWAAERPAWHLARAARAAAQGQRFAAWHHLSRLLDG